MGRRRRFVAGNWKMNGDYTLNEALVVKLLEGIERNDIDIVLFPPALYLDQVSKLVKGTEIKIGVQNISSEDSGAYTGEISAKMVADFNVEYALIGHSERRQLFGESNDDVSKKMRRAIEANLIPVICVGESEEERESGKTNQVIQDQLITVIEQVGIEHFEGAVIAYEPVWAIGTGKSATPEEANAVHEIIRCTFKNYDGNISDLIQIVYGGSVNATNSRTLFEQKEIDGALVGGASLKALEFSQIINQS